MAFEQLTRAELRTRLQGRYEAVPFWTTDEANDAINESLWAWNLLTGRWKRRVVLPTTPMQYELALPSDLTFRMRVLWNGLPLSPTSRDELNYGRPGWRQETTASGGSTPTRPTLWAPVSLSLIYIWPIDAVGHNSWLVDGVSDTPILITDDQYVDLGESDVNLLLGYALHTVCLKQGGDSWAATRDLFTAFLAAAGAENSLITTSQAYRQFLGLDRRDLKPNKGAPSSVAGLVSAVSRGDAGETEAP